MNSDDNRSDAFGSILDHRYFKHFFDSFSRVEKALTDQERHQINAQMISFMVSDANEYRWPPHLSLKFKTFFDSYRASLEVVETFFNVKELQEYFKRHRTKRQRGFADTRYFGFLLSAYFEEVYILRERLLALIKILSRGYLAARIGHANNQVLSGLHSFVIETLKPATDFRKQHVHHSRFEDEELRRISMTEMLLRDQPLVAKSAVSQAIRKFRKRWLQYMTHNQSSFDKLLRAYFDVLERYLPSEKS